MAAARPRSEASPGLLRMVGFNPCAANRISRLADIVAEYPSHDIIVLCGTQQKSSGDVIEDEVIIDNFRGYRFGYKRGPRVSPSCGATIRVKKSRFYKHS
eukprot:6318852-Pyramimonas_sp.AAC.1